MARSLIRKFGKNGTVLRSLAGRASSDGGIALPWRCTSQRWNPSRGMKTAGRITTCRAKNRCTVNSFTSSPPRTNAASLGPITGMDDGISSPTFVAKNASSFIGSR